jgi:hypothetical protein
VDSFTPRPLYPQGEAPGTDWIGGWVGPKARVLNEDINCIWKILKQIRLRVSSQEIFGIVGNVSSI